MKRHHAALAALALLGTTGCDFLRGYAEGESALMTPFGQSTPVGFYRFLFEDFNGLNTDTMSRAALSWKLMGATLLARYHDGEPSEEALLAIYRTRYGLTAPKTVANWPGGQGAYVFTRPMGIVTGKVARGFPDIEVEVSNTGCSACHSSTLWDADGHPTPDVAWVGAPNTNTNFGRYAQDVFDGAEWAIANEEEFVSVLQKTWPKVSRTEVDTIRKFLLPQLEDAIEGVREAGLTGFTPFEHGGTGVANSAGTIQFYLGALPNDRYHPDQNAYSAIPAIGAVRYKPSLFIDGVYAPRGWEHHGELEDPGSERHRKAMAAVFSFISIGTLGVTPEVAVTNAKKMRDIVDFAFDTYEPPPFPGAIDAALADRGAEIFDNRCSGCHGTYAPDGRGRWRITRYPNALVPDSVLGTDPVRWDAVTPKLIELFDATALAPTIQAKRSKGYVPPALDGVWASAPYLHNGSVPTIWHLLTPDARPATFEVGGHRLDYTKLGIAGELDAEGTWRFPANHEPWTIPTVYDTSKRGRSNQGHTSMVAGLTEDEKTALIEHLKRL